jgi:flagellar motor protein MotB
MSSKHHKKHHEEGHEEGWIVSFADLMCLMMSFFVIMAAGNPQDAKIDPEFKEIIAAVKQAFNYLPPADSSDPVDLQILMNQLKSQKGRGGAGKKGDAYQDTEGAVGRHDQVQTIRVGTQTTIGTQIPFDYVSTGLTEEAVVMLTQIAQQMKGHTNIFVIKGHTSADEEHSLVESGRDLGYERARAVAEKLRALGLGKQSLRVQSCRDYEPLKQGAYTDAEQATNRRAEIIATESLVSEVRGQLAKAEHKPAKAPTSQTTTPAH